jgi:hypothetical protein
MKDNRNEKTQLWIAIGNQPGIGTWFSVWLVSRSKRVQPPKAADKKLPRGACTA